MSAGYRRRGGGGGAVAATVFPPVSSDYIATLPPTQVMAASTIGAANRILLARVIAAKAGFLRDFYVPINIASGNIDVAVYDTGDTTATVRTLKGHSTSIACPAAWTGTPTATWDPGAGVIPCTAGQQFEFALSCDNNTASFWGSSGTVGPNMILPITYWPVPGGALPKLASLVAAGSFPAPATITEAALLNGNQGNGFRPFISARISAT